MLSKWTVLSCLADLAMRRFPSVAKTKSKHTKTFARIAFAPVAQLDRATDF